MEVRFLPGARYYKETAMNRQQQKVDEAIRNTMMILTDNMADGRHKSLAYTAMQEALLWVHADEVMKNK